MQGWWFFGDTLRDGRPVPADGEWLVHDRPLVLCESGLHASLRPWDALPYAPGPWLARVTLDGTILHGADKVCAQRRRIDQRVDTEALLRQFARDEALVVLHLWNAPAWAAARDAAWDAAWDTARASAWHAAGARFDVLMAGAFRSPAREDS